MRALGILCVLIFGLGACRSSQPESARLQATPERFSPAELEGLKTEFARVYTEEFAQLGGPFKVNFFRSIPSLYSFATIKNGSYEVAIMGGNLDKRVMDLDSLRLLVCHEIGHFLGGAPKRILLDPTEDQPWNSVEGAADYYASLKCMKRVLKDQDHAVVLEGREVRDAITTPCRTRYENQDDQSLCIRSALAAEKLSLFFAISAQSTLVPQVETPDTSRVERTRFEHPPLQCRLDTYWAGILCPVPTNQSLDDKNPNRGACQEAADGLPQARPPCWFRAADFTAPTLEPLDPS
jgi:hypothetical protein